MELFVQVIGWLLLTGWVLKFLFVGFADYPRVVGRGADTFDLIFNGPLVVWAMLLIWR